jgi:hypothetical protein
MKRFRLQIVTDSKPKVKSKSKKKTERDDLEILKNEQEMQKDQSQNSENISNIKDIVFDLGEVPVTELEFKSGKSTKRNSIQSDQARLIDKPDSEDSNDEIVFEFIN